MPAAAPPAPPPSANPTPAPAPAPAPTPVPAGETPMARAKARMAASAVEADLSDPNPEQTVRQKKASASEPPKPAEPAKPADEPPAPTGAGLELEDDAPPKPPTADKPPEPEKPLLDEKGKPIDKTKVSPWKLLDQFKDRLTATEKENVELREKLAKLPEGEATLKRLESIEKRNKELEEEIRYQNYAKSQEFTEKYQKPYEEAWAKAISDLGELEVLAEDGSVARKATASDLISLARMPLGEARKLANQMFGDSASDVMMHRQKIRDLSDAQNKALEEARKAGSDHQEQSTARQQAVGKEVTTLWEKFNTEDAAKYDFLKPREGDDEFNSKLLKAQQLVDGAFSTNATDPALTTEQRAKVVRAHAAVRNRAIAYSALKLEVDRLKAQIKERDDKLKQYEQSEPTGGSAGASAQPKPAATPMERARQRMHAASVPMQDRYY